MFIFFLETCVDLHWTSSGSKYESEIIFVCHVCVSKNYPMRVLHWSEEISLFRLRTHKGVGITNFKTRANPLHIGCEGLNSSGTVFTKSSKQCHLSFLSSATTREDQKPHNKGLDAVSPCSTSYPCSLNEAVSFWTKRHISIQRRWPAKKMQTTDVCLCAHWIILCVCFRQIRNWWITFRIQDCRLKSTCLC